jgi:hypothetical protein
MDLLKIDGQEGGLSTDLLGLLRELSAKLGNVQAAVDDLRRHHLSGVKSSAVTAAIAALGLDAERIQVLFSEHAAVLGWLPRPLGELGAQRHHWPFRKEKGAGLGSAPLTFGVQAGVDAGIETDVDGEILDGAVTYDKDQQLFVRLGVEATLDGEVGYSGPLGAAAAQAAFKTGGAVTLANYFRHRRDETVFDALVADARAFTLPGRATASGLRSRIQVLPGGQVTLADQYVHLHAQGFVQVSGSLRWGRQVVRAASVKVDALDLDESLSLSAGLTASARFSQLLSGDFDLLLSAAPTGAPWLALSLAKSKTSKREAGFKVGAEAGVAGLDRVGRGLLAAVVPSVERLIGTIEARGEELADLRSLFLEKLEATLDARLKKPKVVQQIESWVKALGQDIELRPLLKKVLSEVAVDVAEDELALPTVSAKVVGAVQELIRRYRATLERVQEALERASQLSVGISFALASRRLEQEDTALALELDGSSENGRRLLRQALVGDFDEAIRAAQAGDASVHIVGGTLARSGLLERTTTLGINLFGLPFNSVSILRQEWHSRVSLAGDVSLGVKTELEKQHLGWSHARTCRFLADTALLATVGEADGGLTGVARSDRLALEINDAFRPTIKELEAFSSTLARLGIGSAQGVIVKDLALEEGGSKAFGALSTSILLEMGRPEIDRLLAQAEVEVRRRFTESLLAFFVGPARFHVRDAAGAPLLLWKRVQELKDFINGSRPPTTALVFRDDLDATSHTYTQDELPLLFFYCRLINAFSDAVSQLRSFRGTLVGRTPEQAVAAIRQAQRSLVRSLAPLVEGTLVRGHHLNYVLFDAFRALMASDHLPKAFAVVRRDADDRVFVYE